jgi:DNA helicase-2/ATP-dependent DNA helicase PcrA
MIITSRDKICIEKDFKVEAGPGAGKTEFIVDHIKNVPKIQRDYLVLEK